MTLDYVSPNLSVPRLDSLFPNMVEGDKSNVTWPYLRKSITHTWYVDRRNPVVGFIDRDEASILYCSAQMFRGRRGLEIGAWRGWSTCHLLTSGLSSLDVIEPLLLDSDWREEFQRAVNSVNGKVRANLIADKSPSAVERLASEGRKWSFAFIDGEHLGAAPLHDAAVCEPRMEADALVLFHDLVVPDVAAGLREMAARGWKVALYQTAQMMGVAWRGDVEPVKHIPDPGQPWTVPDHLAGLPIFGGDRYRNLDD